MYGSTGGKPVVADAVVVCALVAAGVAAVLRPRSRSADAGGASAAAPGADRSALPGPRGTRASPPGSVDLRDVADQAVADLGLLDPGRPIAREDSGRTSLVADPELLLHVARNLLGNALQHTPGGTPVTVAVRGGARGPDGGRRVELSVSDQAPCPGPPATARPSAQGLRDGAPGRGLGLAIISEVAGRHGGEVTVRSAPGRGTTVTVAFPAAGFRAPGAPPGR